MCGKETDKTEAECRYCGLVFSKWAEYKQPKVSPEIIPKDLAFGLRNPLLVYSLATAIVLIFGYFVLDYVNFYAAGEKAYTRETPQGEFPPPRPVEEILREADKLSKVEAENLVRKQQTERGIPLSESFREAVYQGNLLVFLAFHKAELLPRAGIVYSSNNDHDSVGQLVGASERGYGFSDQNGGRDPLARGRYNEEATPLVLAAHGGHVEILERMLALMSKEPGKYGFGDINLAFSVACETGQTEAAKCLRKHGADIRFRDGLTPLSLAVWNGNSDTADFLLDQGADPNEGIGMGPNPYLAKKLIERGANVHRMYERWDYRTLFIGFSLDDNRNGYIRRETTAGGATPLMIAAWKAEPETVEIFLKAGADVHAKDNAGYDALFYAARRMGGPYVYNMASVLRFMDGGRCTKLLLAAGANPNTLAGGQSARHVALKENSFLASQILKEAGGKIIPDLNKSETGEPAPYKKNLKGETHLKGLSPIDTYKLFAKEVRQKKKLNDLGFFFSDALMESIAAQDGIKPHYPVSYVFMFEEDGKTTHFSDVKYCGDDYAVFKRFHRNNGLVIVPYDQLSLWNIRGSNDRNTRLFRPRTDFSYIASERYSTIVMKKENGCWKLLPDYDGSVHNQAFLKI